MSFRRQENFCQPEFCADCPPAIGMEQVEVRTSNNLGPTGGMYWNVMPPNKKIYAQDPENPEAGAIVLGDDYPTDPFCVCHETSQSIVLGNTHQLIEACEGPIIETSWFGLRKTKVCGAGFRNNRKFIDALNEQGKEYKNLVTVVRVEPRRPKNTAHIQQT